MSVEGMPEVLAWRHGTSLLEERYKWYVLLLGDFLGFNLRKTTEVCPHLTDQIQGQVECSSPEGFLRLLTAPETAFRIFDQDPQRLASTALFLRDSFYAERLRERKGVEYHNEVWTALGDTGYRADGTTIASSPLIDEIPLDFCSPYTTKLDLEGNELQDTVEDPYRYPHEMAATVTQRLRQASAGIRSSSSLVHSFIRTFTKVIVIRRAPDRDIFIAGSNSATPGRTMLVNPELPTVTNEQLADAIVHEAIHDLLSIEEMHRRWTSQPSLLSEEVPSPWTGRRLTLFAYLQACFVWYGLFNFWMIAESNTAFDCEEARRCLEVAASGFKSERLTASIDKWHDAMSSELITAIDEMQALVISSSTGR